MGRLSDGIRREVDTSGWRHDDIRWMDGSMGFHRRRRARVAHRRSRHVHGQVARELWREFTQRSPQVGSRSLVAGSGSRRADAEDLGGLRDSEPVPVDEAHEFCLC